MAKNATTLDSTEWRRRALAAEDALRELVDWFLVHIHGGGATTTARRDYQASVAKAGRVLDNAKGR
jgi:hypothetical protein